MSMEVEFITNGVEVQAELSVEIDDFDGSQYALFRAGEFQMPGEDHWRNLATDLEFSGLRVDLIEMAESRGQRVLDDGGYFQEL